MSDDNRVWKSFKWLWHAIRAWIVFSFELIIFVKECAVLNANHLANVWIRQSGWFSMILHEIKEIQSAQVNYLKWTNQNFCMQTMVFGALPSFMINYHHHCCREIKPTIKSSTQAMTWPKNSFLISKEHIRWLWKCQFNCWSMDLVEASREIEETRLESDSAWFQIKMKLKLDLKRFSVVAVKLCQFSNGIQLKRRAFNGNVVLRSRNVCFHHFSKVEPLFDTETMDPLTFRQSMPFDWIFWL